jgi:phosphoglycerate dehydrogenase-like enzyme
VSINAVIDVTEPEVLPANSPLYHLPNLLLTPHIAGALGGERNRLGDMIADEVERHARGEQLLYAITPERLERMA